MHVNHITSPISRQLGGLRLEFWKGVNVPSAYPDSTYVESSISSKYFNLFVYELI